MTQTDQAAFPIVILTGAGISRESGLSTFRDADGIWAQVNLEEVATPRAFERDPEKVHGFYNARRRGLLDQDVQPNVAHKALARLEREWPGDVLVVTQNVDDLHERAGSRSLIHMHGELLKGRCLRCEHVTPWSQDMSTESACPSCGHRGGMRPQIVWFGEVPFMMDRIEEALINCGLFMSIGTSGNVYPAAGFVDLVERVGRAQTVEVNLEPSEGASQFQETVYGPATETVPQIVEQILGYTA